MKEVKLSRLRAQYISDQSKNMGPKYVKKLIRTTGLEEMHGYWSDGYVDGVLCGQMADKSRAYAFQLYKTLYLEYIEVGSWKIMGFDFSSHNGSLYALELQLIHISCRYSTYMPLRVLQQ